MSGKSGSPLSVEPPVEPLCDPVLVSAGIPHGFGQKGSQVPGNTAFSAQVHGVRVVSMDVAAAPGELPEADAVLTTRAGSSVGIVTADCVPVLAAAADGSAVVAIHAGWRGLASGVIEAGMEALAVRAPGRSLVAAIGPAARGCCYEVDAPVADALSERYRPHLEGVLSPGRKNHFQLDLPLLAARILADRGLEATQIGVEQRVCTICDPDRFESFRRDGVAAGRLRHFVSCP